MSTYKDITIKHVNKALWDEMKPWDAKRDLAEELHSVSSSGFKGDSPWGITGLLESIDSPNTVLVLASINNKLAGFLMASETELELDIYIIVVASTHKRKGIGTKLLEYLMAYGHEKKIESIILETRESNTAARNLYKKVGFKEVGLRKAYYSSPVEHAVVMRYDLRKEIPDC